MTVEKLLKNYFYIGVRIQRLERDLARIRMQAESVRGISYEERLASNSPQSGGFEEKVMEAVEMERILLAKKQRLRKMSKKVEAIIDSVEDERAKAILELRYYDCMKFEKIADELHYSVERIYQLHREIIHKLEEENEQIH